MEVAAHIEAIRAEGDLMAAAVAAAGPDAAVPTCPEWTVHDLARHLGGVHRWATDIVATPRLEPGPAGLDEIVGTWPDDDALAPWLLGGAVALADTLAAAPADLECWAFLRAPSPLAMWARRQAHETAVHRVDAELAAGRAPRSVSPLAPAFAADGADELLTCFVPRRGTKLRADPPRSLGVVCTDADADAAWVLEIGPEGVVASGAGGGGDGGGSDGGGGTADCTVRGRAEDLYLTLWNRRDPGVLTAEGDAGVLRLFLDGVHVR